jgi:glutamyl-tRNA reductase
MNTNLYVVGISYEKANQEIRSKYSLSEESIQKILLEAKNKGINSLVVLSTCNRTEIIGYVPHPYIIIELFCKYSNGTVDELTKYAYIFKQNDAVLHLFELTSGIKSQILGDYEIVKQLKAAFKTSKNNDILDSYLERLFNHALQASKEVKNTTEISGGTTSTSYAGIQYLKNKFGSLNEKNIAILGLGDIGKSTLKNLIQYSDANHITVLNRTASKAEAFIKFYKKVKVGDFNNLKIELKNQDILFVCSNAPKPIITNKNVNSNSKFTIIDLSVPSNVAKEVANINSIDLVKLDDLSNITDTTFEARKREIPKAKEIIEKHKNEFQTWLSNRKFTPVLNGLKETLQNIKKTEIKSTIKNNPEQKEIVDLITDKVLQKITNRFAHHLKNDPKMANQSIEVIKEVFNIKI